jgi:hypothetical protein
LLPTTAEPAVIDDIEAGRPGLPLLHVAGGVAVL